MLSKEDYEKEKEKIHQKFEEEKEDNQTTE